MMMSCTAAALPEESVTLGVFTDIQYANKPDKEANYLDGTKMRFYSLSLAKTSRAVYHFNQKKVSTVLHLGDIIDGNETPEETTNDLKAVLETIAPLKARLEFIIGNHCLDNGRDMVLPALGFNISQQRSTNRTILISSSWRLIILDSMAMSVSNPASENLFAEAKQYIENHGQDENATPYNGGIGEEQTVWLREQLKLAAQDSTNVIVCLHHPVSLQSSSSSLMLWNYEEIMSILSEYKETVRACFSGHHHAGGYACEFGIHFVVFESIIDSVNEFGSYGTVTLHRDRIVINGEGEMTSRVLNF